jgi:S-(hydroxymethyl)glutathione dehydrogenase/alcohol dehydrogenase
VLADIKASRICGSQIGEIDGVKGPDKWLRTCSAMKPAPLCLKSVPKFATSSPGDVVCHWRPGRGIEGARCL